MSLPLQEPEIGFIDCVTHNLTGMQTLYHMLYNWKEDSRRPLILWCLKGTTEAQKNTIKVALSRERKIRGAVRTFELRFGEAWPYTHDGIRGDAMVVTRSLGSLTTRMNEAFQYLKHTQKGFPL